MKFSYQIYRQTVADKDNVVTVCTRAHVLSKSKNDYRRKWSHLKIDYPFSEDRFKMSRILWNWDIPHINCCLSKFEWAYNIFGSYMPAKKLLKKRELELRLEKFLLTRIMSNVRSCFDPKLYWKYVNKFKIKKIH